MTSEKTVSYKDAKAAIADCEAMSMAASYLCAPSNFKTCDRHRVVEHYITLLPDWAFDELRDFLAKRHQFWDARMRLRLRELGIEAPHGISARL